MLEGAGRSIWRCLLISGLLAVGGCGLLDPEVCHTGLFYDVTPRAAAISIGESFTPSAMLESCPEGVRELALTWTAEDPSIVLVESGQVTGLSEGETVVQGEDDQENVLVTIPVAVSPAS
jgi:hypothetical protein